ncbi:MAG: DNA sulfur modification protein DndD, partial [Halobacteriovoraceae bacterium]|nr:DNA sulfur modification protein DndD [Halobacteriovoraceae bacterium]
DYLKSRINWFCPNDEATLIELAFTLFRDHHDPKKAREYQYRIVREWYTNHNGNIEEKFNIYQDEVLLELDPSFWQDFIEEIIPQGVIDLFFFDGEKIQGLAEGGNHELRDAIKSLLNLKIIPTLSEDLSSIYKKYVEQDLTKDTKEFISELKSNLTKEEKVHSKLIEDRTELQRAIAAIQNNLKIHKKELKDQGGEYYAERDRLTKEKGNAELLKNQHMEAIGKMMEYELPLMLSPKYVQKVNKQLSREIEIAEKEVTLEVLSNKKKELDAFLKKSTKDKDLLNKVKGFTEAWIVDLDSEESKYNLSVNEVKRSLDVINSLEGKERELDELFEKVDLQDRRIARFKEALARAIDNDKVKVIHEKINHETLKLGNKEKELQIKDSEIDKTLREQTDIKKKLESAYKIKTRNSEKTANYERVDALREILKEFESSLTSERLGQLEEEILSCYMQIHRKTGFIRSVKIDPDTFEVTLFDKSGLPVPVEKLSAGEKQVYAISVLWALSKTSGKGLPMIIDTPLGRLDSSHRTNLVQNFFPNASHQVVILSTDTEIDKHYFDELNKHVSHTYNIDFNLEDTHSKVR